MSACLRLERRRQLLGGPGHGHGSGKHDADEPQVEALPLRVQPTHGGQHRRRAAVPPDTFSG